MCEILFFNPANAPGGKGPMKITRISTAVLEANFDWTFVKVETDQGITGIGEAFVAPGLTSIIREYAAILTGEDPTHIDRLVRRMKGSTVYASPGMVYHAIGGIECALLDIIGKRYGMPIWQILGGKYRDRVRIYADTPAPEEATPPAMRGAFASASGSA